MVLQLFGLNYFHKRGKKKRKKNEKHKPVQRDKETLRGLYENISPQKTKVRHIKNHRETQTPLRIIKVTESTGTNEVIKDK